MKIEFNSDDELPLNKTIVIPTITIVVRAVFYENKKYYPKVEWMFLRWMFMLIIKSYIMIELMFLKELILIKQMHQKSAIFVTIVMS